MEIRHLLAVVTVLFFFINALQGKVFRKILSAVCICFFCHSRFKYYKTKNMEV